MVKTSIVVLLLEPDEQLAQNYTNALTQAGEKVMWATTAQQALQTIDTKTPDIIVLEINLIEHNGIEFLYELQSYADTSKIPVILVTYSTKKELGLTRKQQEKLSIIEYCYKPKTTIEDLVHAVQGIVL